MTKLLIIKKPFIFKNVAKQGIAIKDKAFILKYLPSSTSHIWLNTNKVQIGLVLSKKLGIAVKRNYLKRVLKNAIKDSLNSFVLNGFYVFIVKDNLSYVSYKEIIQKIKFSLKQLHNLINNNEEYNN